MNEVALFLGAAAVAYGLARWTRLPILPLLIACGFGISLTPLAPDHATAQAMVEFGLAFLVFGAGIELNPRRFVRQSAAAFWVAIIQFLAVGFVAMATALALGYPPAAATYVGFAVSASSTVVVIRHLRTQQQMFTPFGRLVTGVLLLQDIALVAVLVALVQGTTGLWESVLSLGILGILGAVAIAVHIWGWPFLTRRLRGEDEVLLLSSLALLAVFLAGAAAGGLPIVVGAFLAGFSLASFPGNALLRGLIGSVTDFFQALFFTALGAMLTFSDFAEVWHAMVFSALVFLVTPPLVALVAEWRGLNARSGIESGLLLAQTSELGVIISLVGLHLGQIDQSVFTTLALVAALTMTLTPFLANDAITWKLLRFHPSSRKPHLAQDLAGHVVVLGFGGAGMWVVKPLLAAGHKVVVVDEDPAVLAGLANAGVLPWRGDASDLRTLNAVGAHKALLVLAALPRMGDLLKVIRHLRDVTVVARVFEQEEAREVERAGGVAILNSMAAADQFEAWFENFRRGGGGAQAIRSSHAAVA
jgi:CPA2 family monovalent cation:H+ antiporter-2